jgi:hypothetical protein
VAAAARGRLPGYMDAPNPQPDATPHDDVEAEHLAEVTKMSVDSSRTFLDFHSGMRWLRRDPE